MSDSKPSVGVALQIVESLKSSPLNEVQAAFDTAIEAGTEVALVMEAAFDRLDALAAEQTEGSVQIGVSENDVTAALVLIAALSRWLPGAAWVLRGNDAPDLVLSSKEEPAPPDAPAE